MAITLFAAGSATALAEPGFQPHGGHGFPDGGRRDDIPRPGDRFRLLPDIATTVLLGGLTYYLVNGIYYQRQGAQYVVVENPHQRPPHQVHRCWTLTVNAITCVTVIIMRAILMATILKFRGRTGSDCSVTAAVL